MNALMVRPPSPDASLIQVRLTTRSGIPPSCSGSTTERSNIDQAGRYTRVRK